MTNDRRSLLIYVLMLLGSVGAFLAIRTIGAGIAAPAPDVLVRAATGARPGTLIHVLLALLVILIAARALGALFAHFKQPPVVGEMIAGILLGPSLLGKLAPASFHLLFPHQILPFISVLAQVGIILYMFLMGVQLDMRLVTGRAHATVAISHASILCPFILGSALALWLYPMYSTSDVSFTVFALLIGVAMSITAFPVLARILSDRGLNTSEIGAIALACAAVDDVTAWCLLALVVSVAHEIPAHALITLALTAAFIAAIFIFGPKLAARYAAYYERGGSPYRQQHGVMIACVALLVAAVATQYIGIQALFGAFLVGVVIPRDSLFARDLVQEFEDLVVVLFLPAFFVFSGLRTQIGLLNTAAGWGICLIIIVVATIGKFASGALAARITGISWRQSAALGALMNARGLVELIVVNIGLDLGVLTPTLFTMFVIMAVVTTLTAAPVLNLLDIRREALVPARIAEARP